MGSFWRFCRGRGRFREAASGGAATGTVNTIALGSDSTIAVDGGSTLNVSTISGTNTNVALAGSGTGNITSALSVGTGNLTVSGGTWNLVTDSVTYGNTVVSGGTLRVGNGGTVGHLSSGTVTVNGTLAFNRSDSYTESHDISGTGGIRQDGPGTLLLAGNNTFSGASSIYNGVVPIGPTNLTALGGTDSTGGYTTIGGNSNTGRVALSGGITLAEPFTLSCRELTALNAPEISNVSGNNTFTGPISITTGGTNVNIE